MNSLEQALLAEALADAHPRHCVRTGTRIDAGHWWRRAVLWACLTDEELILLGVGRRRYVDRTPVAETSETYYNHATGELVVQPAETLRFRRLRLSPSEALRFLSIHASLLPRDAHATLTH